MSEKKEVIQKPATMMAEALTVDEVVAHVKVIRDAVARVMEKGENKDYGIIPGTDKPALFKAGAEKLCVLFRLAPSFDTTEYFDGQHLTVKSKCTLTHINSGKVMGAGDAICSTKEKKYAKRRDSNRRLVDNNELPDLYNTVIKMADKRALVAAVLVVTAASSEFTQDRGDEEKPVDHPDEKREPKADSKPEPKKEIEGKAEVKEAPKATPKEPLVVADGLKTWVGKLTEIEPSITPKGTKFLLIRGENKEAFIIRKPADSDKAANDLYTMRWKDLEDHKTKGLEVSIEYTVAENTGSWMLQSYRVPEAMPF